MSDNIEKHRYSINSQRAGRNASLDIAVSCFTHRHVCDFVFTESQNVRGWNGPLGIT